MARVLTSLLVLAAAGPAEAQLDLRVPFDTGYEYGDEHPDPEALRRVRSANLEQHRREGWWVFGWGVASALAGGVLAIALRDEPEWLSFGLTTAAFGAIDAGLALGMVDLSGSEREAIDAGRLGDLSDRSAILDESIAAQRKAGQIFALNFGLDVAYIASGILMFFLGRAQDPNEGLLTGSGIAMISQGAFLLGFDLIAWIRTGKRADALEALR